MTPTQIAHYRITAKLGEGGMGAVYRATDTKLNRDVAIKILPEAFASDPDRFARFTREAQLLAALNHPSIAAIYGIEDRAIVMELIEGPTLEDRIAQGALPLDEALAIARQIAEALETAHDKGIIHRDLKPANIKLTPDAKVKVLDFGLAKLHDPRDPAEDPSSAPTVLRGNSPTISGMIMGTAEYMSPEQAAGKPVDKRADIWSFGVVLYEMLTGRRLFQAETVSHTLADVLRAPIDLTSAPAAIRPLLTRCLDRNPKTRLRDIGEARFALDNPLPALDAPTPLPQRRLPWALLAATALATAALTFAITAARRPAAPPLQQLRYTISDATGPFALSPDGRRIAFFAPDNNNNTSALWVRSLDSLEPRRISGLASNYFFWAPDSQHLAVHSLDGKLWRVDVDKETRQLIANVPVLVQGSWSQSGKILYSESGTQHYLIDPNGGSPQKIPLNVVNGRSSILLPDGEHVLQLTPLLELSYRSLRGGTPITLLQGPTSFAFAAGKLLTVAGGKLSSQPFDEKTGKITGESTVIASPLSSFSVSQTGILAFREGAYTTLNPMAWIDRSGKVISTVSTGSHNEPSPDGKLLAYDALTETGDRDVWVLDLARDLRHRITHTKPGRREWVPSWSPDSKSVFFVANRQGRASDGEIYTRPADGSGAEQLVHSASAPFKHHSHISPDGSLLIFDGSDSTQTADIFLLPLNVPPAQRQPKPFLNGPFREAQPQFSPDGKLIAYISNETGVFEVYVHTLNGPPKRWRLSQSGGISPRWRNDGKEIIFLAADGKIISVPATGSGHNFNPGAPVTLFQSIMRGIESSTHIAINPDASRILLRAATQSIQPLTVFVNWDRPAK